MWVGREGEGREAEFLGGRAGRGCWQEVLGRKGRQHGLRPGQRGCRLKASS